MELEVIPSLEIHEAEDIPILTYSGAHGLTEVPPLHSKAEGMSIVRVPRYPFGSGKFRAGEETIEGYSARVARHVGAKVLYLGDLLDLDTEHPR